MDLVKLKEKISDSGYKLNHIEAQLGLTKQGFLNKINGKTEFTLSEASTLAKLLNLTSEEQLNIFFAR